MVFEKLNGETGSGKLILRWFGHSTEPIRKFIAHCKDQENESTKLQVTIIKVDVVSYTERPKLPLASIDLEPALLSSIKEDAERYFHDSSQDFHAATGNPFRRVYLLTGPPGTGKTSLSVGLASHFQVPSWCFILLEWITMMLTTPFRNCRSAA